MKIPKTIINKVLKNLEKADKEFRKLNQEQQNKLLLMFDDHYTIQHCLRRGIQACQDLKTE